VGASVIEKNNVLVQLSPQTIGENKKQCSSGQLDKMVSQIRNLAGKK
jgi:hypothetical protein